MASMIQDEPRIAEPVGDQQYSAAEWQVRRDLAALYRLAARFGMSDVIYNHISARVPGTDDQFLINPLGMLFEHMTASALVKIDFDGNPVTSGEGPASLVNKAGFVIHSAVHMARPELHWVMHSHTTAGMAISMQKEGLLPLSQHAMMFYGQIGYHDYESFATGIEERERLIRDLGDRSTLILRNHGTIVTGRTVGHVFNAAYHLERACQAQLLATASGIELTYPPIDVAEQTARRAINMPPAHAELFWLAARSMLDPVTTDYRD